MLDIERRVRKPWIVSAWGQRFPYDVLIREAEERFDRLMDEQTE